MDGCNLYVLTRLSIDAAGKVTSDNVGVSFDVFEAEAHRARGIENDFEVFVIASNWREDAEQSSLVAAMRGFRVLVRQMQEEALR
ncbi:MAG: hypothetical protein WA485_15080 [Candidatus Sulfotelmatobacter sp.]